MKAHLINYINDYYKDEIEMMKKKRRRKKRKKKKRMLMLPICLLCLNVNIYIFSVSTHMLTLPVCVYNKKIAHPTHPTGNKVHNNEKMKQKEDEMIMKWWQHME